MTTMRALVRRDAADHPPGECPPTVPIRAQARAQGIKTHDACALVGRLPMPARTAVTVWHALRSGRRPLLFSGCSDAAIRGWQELREQLTAAPAIIAQADDDLRVGGSRMEGHGHIRPTWAIVLKRTALILIPLTVLLLLVLLWSWSLRWQVAQRTTELRQGESLYRNLFETAPVGIFASTPEGNLLASNPAMARMLGFDSAEETQSHYTDLKQQLYVHPERRDHLLQALRQNGFVHGFEFEAHGRGNRWIWVSLDASMRTQAPDDSPVIEGFVRDISRRKEDEKTLRGIEWMLAPEHDRPLPESAYTPSYGDLGALNTTRTIREAVGQEGLRDVMHEFLDLLDTSAAVHEKSGDCAMELLAPGWCRYLDQASRDLCETDDDAAALGCGKWVCKDTARSAAAKAMQQRRPVDVDCPGGIQMHAVPIIAEERVVGALSVGYGDPPRDPESLRHIANRYGVSIERLRRLAESSESRPPYIVAVAKRRLNAAARLIGEIVERHESQKRTEALSRFAEENPNPVLRIRAQGVLDYANKAAQTLAADELQAAVGQPVTPEWRDHIASVLAADQPIELQVSVNRNIYEMILAPVPQAGYVNIYGRDVTEKRKLESDLQQAQKMNAVGNLAGGVAHDFNNLIMGIMNYVDLCREHLDDNHPASEYLNEIANDAKRSANLTRQLLAFARRQTIDPEVMDLNQALEGMLKLLRRLIGEDIDLHWVPGKPLWPVKMDPSQLDQILANLCVNARDAIEGTGRVTVETTNVAVDRDYAASRVDAVPGKYVVLAVSDDGTGVDPDFLERLFEPFFTTKESGTGTGLGLATVYGIVRQNGGFVSVYSEPDQGTTFRIYLPRADEAPTTPAPEEDTDPPVGGTETVLVVEDEKSVRVTAELFLKKLGYRVLTAETPNKALTLARRHDDTIHLLITDVVMPGISGRELADILRDERPGLKALFMSGYTANVIAHQGILDDGVDFLAKPFRRTELTRTVREILDRNDEAGA